MIKMSRDNKGDREDDEGWQWHQQGWQGQNACQNMLNFFGLIQDTKKDIEI